MIHFTALAGLLENMTPIPSAEEQQSVVVSFKDVVAAAAFTATENHVGSQGLLTNQTS